jgi:hypothetical protein
MDLRKYGLSPNEVKRGTGVLNYQPFILSDDIQTGVAYSWLYGAEGGRAARAGEFLCYRGTVAPELWDQFTDANARLRAMYEDWLDAIAGTYAGGSLLDPACNNGYFLSGALLRKMKRATGYDRVDYTSALQFLNDTTGTDATFIHRAYSPWTHRIDDCEPHDVVVASLILCHISDPLYFLAFLGKMAKEALFLFTGMGTQPGYAVYYSKPNRFYTADEFPVCFDNDVGTSRDLLFDSLALMGFKNIRILEHRPTWLPPSWYNTGNQQAILAMRP